jgi:hypothetical protein
LVAIQSMHPSDEHVHDESVPPLVTPHLSMQTLLLHSSQLYMHDGSHVPSNSSLGLFVDLHLPQSVQSSMHVALSGPHFWQDMQYGAQEPEKQRPHGHISWLVTHSPVSSHDSQEGSHP